MDGFILLHRKIFDHWIYDNGNYFKWWCKLLFLANYEDSNIVVGFTPTIIKRGQMRASVSFLMESFGCKNRNTVVRFLKLLEREKMITRVTKHKQTFITINNYDEYQSPWLSNVNSIKFDTNRDTDVDTNRDTDVDTQTNNINKEKEYITPPNISNDTLVPLTGANKKSPEKRREEMDKRMESARQEFYNSLVPYVTTYGKEMVREFFDYWTEPNKSRSKMRFEQQKTWDTPRRLAYWSNRDSARTHRSSEPVIQY